MRLEQFENFEPLFVDVCVPSGEPDHRQTEFEFMLSVRRPVAASFWIREIGNGGGREGVSSTSWIASKNIGANAPIGSLLAVQTAKMSASLASLLRCHGHSLSVDGIEEANRVAERKETAWKRFEPTPGSGIDVNGEPRSGGIFRHRRQSKTVRPLRVCLLGQFANDGRRLCLSVFKAKQGWPRFSANLNGPARRATTCSRSRLHHSDDRTRAEHLSSSDIAFRGYPRY
jgi:hypothetical protein